jgi:hypothetical protein
MLVKGPWDRHRQDLAPDALFTVILREERIAGRPCMMN